MPLADLVQIWMSRAAIARYLTQRNTAWWKGAVGSIASSPKMSWNPSAEVASHCISRFEVTSVKMWH